MELDYPLWIAVLILAAWTFYNINRSVAIYKSSDLLNDAAQVAKEIAKYCTSTVIQLNTVSANVVARYGELMRLQDHYSHLSNENFQLSQLAPNLLEKKLLIDNLSNEDKLLHVTITGPDGITVVDNQITIIYRKETNTIEFYDNSCWCKVDIDRSANVALFDYLSSQFNRNK